MLKTITLAGCGVLAVLSLTSFSGCGQQHFPAALGLPLAQINIILDSDLSAEEKRDALAAYDIDPVTLNGLLTDERLANQFGGSLASAIGKVQAERMSTLTPDELQYYADATDVTTYSDTEAQEIVDFLVDEQIGSLAALGEFLEDPSTALPAEIDETDLRGVFVETDITAVQDKLP